MAGGRLSDALLAAGSLAATIIMLATAFLLILRTSRLQFSLRFLLLTIGSIAVALGLWTALLRSANPVLQWQLAPSDAPPALGPAEPEPAADDPPKPNREPSPPE